jgi:hypothetical protein
MACVREKGDGVDQSDARDGLVRGSPASPGDGSLWSLWWVSQKRGFVGLGRVLMRRMHSDEYVCPRDRELTGGLEPSRQAGTVVGF